MLDIIDNYGRKRALCGGSMGPPGKSGVGICPPLFIPGNIPNFIINPELHIPNTEFYIELFLLVAFDIDKSCS